MTVTATTTSTSQSSGIPEGQDYLAYYMQKAAEILIHLTQLVAQNTNTQSQIVDQIINMTEDQAKQAAENAQKVMEAIEAQRNQSSFSKLFGEIFGGILILIGALTGDPVLVMTGVLLIAMSTSGAQEKLDEKIAHLDPWLQGLINLGIAAGTALTTAGIAGGVRAIAAGTEAGAQAGARGGVKNAASFALSELPSAAGQATMIFNPYIGFTQEILERCGVDKEKAKFIAQIIGVIMALITAGGMAKIGSSLQESGKLAKLANLSGSLKVAMGEESLQMLTRLVQFIGSAFAGASSAFSILAGTTGLKAAELVKERGEISSLQVIFKAILDTVQYLVDQTQSSAQTNNSTFRVMNDNWMNYLSPYDSKFMQG